MTQRYIFPEWMHECCGGWELYQGGRNDIGDRGFVFSFHIHRENKVKCEQLIKGQILPFLPHHIIDLWPIYFHPKNRNIDKKYDIKYIYEKWKLPTNDTMLTKWIEIIDPKYYKALQDVHLKYQHKAECVVMGYLRINSSNMTIDDVNYLIVTYYDYYS